MIDFVTLHSSVTDIMIFKLAVIVVTVIAAVLIGNWLYRNSRKK